MKLHIRLGFCLDCLTFETSEVVTAVIARHVIPGVPFLRTKSVYAVLIFVIVWLLWSPEPKPTYLSVFPHKQAFYAPIIQPYPGSLAVMTVLNVDVFLLVMNRHEMRTHRRTI